MPCAFAESACLRHHIVARLTGVRREALGDQHYAHCPAHDDQHASFGIRPGDKQRHVWSCKAGCSPAAIRDALLDLRIDEDCLGNYGRYRAANGLPDAERKLRDISALLRTGRHGHEMAMRIQALIEGESDLPAGREDFYGLADRAGVSRTQKYVLWEKRGAP